MTVSGVKKTSPKKVTVIKPSQINGHEEEKKSSGEKQQVKIVK